MYVRQLKGIKLSLGVSGLLWHRSLVMYDQETNSQWSHLLGRAMSGKLKGTELQQIPSVMTTWAGFRDAHPDATVVMMERTSKDYTDQIYRPRNRFVFGIAQGQHAAAWSFETLQKQPVVHGTWQKQPFVILFDRAAVTPRMYATDVDGRQLLFVTAKTPDGTDSFRDEQTKSIWNPISGKATAGPLKGKFLTSMPAIVSFKKAWQTFHPKSEMK